MNHVEKKVLHQHTPDYQSLRRYENINLLATDFFFQILAHPVFKM